EAVAFDPPHDDVVEHRRVVLVEQMRVLRPTGPDLAEIVGERELQPFERVGTYDPHSAEMADVEGHRRGPAGAVLRERAAGVGQRDLASPEGEQLRPEGAVDGVEWRVPKRQPWSADASVVRPPGAAAGGTSSLIEASTSCATRPSDNTFSTPCPVRTRSTSSP